MEIDMKKWFIILGLAVGGFAYVVKHYTFRDVLNYSIAHPDPAVSPKLDYYVGMAWYLRSYTPGAVEAFQQVLTDYPTSYFAPKAMLRLGTVYTEQRQFADARDIYERYMAEYPEGEQIQSVKDKYEFVRTK
jgi:TolA-binding protein